MASLSEVRDLKRRWYNLIEAKPTGFGLTLDGKGENDWVLKVNTLNPPAGEVPSSIDGIPLLVEHVGKVTAAAAVEYDANPT
jgi:hypothetical protein